MADDIDLAQRQDELFREMALQGQRRSSPVRGSLSECCICGEDIPLARQLAAPGCCKCIVCQTEYESMHGK